MTTLVYTPDELAQELGLPRSTVDRWRYKRTGPPAIKIGRHIRYRSSDVVAWLDSQPDRIVPVDDWVDNRVKRPVPSAGVSSNGAQIASCEESTPQLTVYVCHACTKTVDATDDAACTAQGWVHRNDTWLCTACSYTQ